MKILFFLALLANLVFFLWQYNAGAFQHVSDNVEPATPAPKQIWLLSELEKKPPVNIVKNQILPATMSITTAPATIMTRAIKNNPQHLVTSTVTNSVNPATATAKNAQ